MKYKNITITFSLLGMTFLTAWTTLLLFRASPTPINHPQQDSPDAFMEQVVSIMMDKEGKPRLKIISPKMTHYAINDTTHFETPLLILYQQSTQPWLISSKFALATYGIDNVNFWDNVTIHHDADEANPTTLIKTATLLVHPHQQTAETTDFITMTQPNLTVTARGMQADMHAGDVKLLSQAKGIYVPDS